MTARVLFIHGAGGEEAYEADGRLVESLRRELGAGFEIAYPQMPDGGYEAWSEQITRNLTGTAAGVTPATRSRAGSLFLVGHSHGGSVLIKYLTEVRSEVAVRCVFLIAPPFWGSEGWEMEEFELAQEAASALPRDLPIHFYFARDDDIVPFSHLELYRSLLPSATFHAIDAGGHQFGEDMAVVAKDLLGCYRS